MPLQRKEKIRRVDHGMERSLETCGSMAQFAKISMLQLSQQKGMLLSSYIHIARSISANLATEFDEILATQFILGLRDRNLRFRALSIGGLVGSYTFKRAVYVVEKISTMNQAMLTLDDQSPSGNRPSSWRNFEHCSKCSSSDISRSRGVIREYSRLSSLPPDEFSESHQPLLGSSKNSAGSKDHSESTAEPASVVGTSPMQQAGPGTIAKPSANPISEVPIECNPIPVDLQSGSPGSSINRSYNDESATQGLTERSTPPANHRPTRSRPPSTSKSTNSGGSVNKYSQGQPSGEAGEECNPRESYADEEDRFWYEDNISPTVDAATCTRCGKDGHFAKECQSKTVLSNDKQRMIAYMLENDRQRFTPAACN